MITSKMKPKNQLPLTSENDAKDKLIIYVYEYLINSGAKNAAETFLEEIHYEREVRRNPNDGTGFLAGWWFVFWDLYCASSDKKPGQPEPSPEARTFHEINRQRVAQGMSPSCGPNTSPSGPPGGFMSGCGPPMMGGPRYATSYPNHQMRPAPMNVPGPRMMNMMGQGGPPPPQPQMVGPPSQPTHPGSPMMSSPRYVPHNGHMTPGSSASSGPVNVEPGPSPGVNRMTPNHSGSPHPQQVGPPNNMSPMSGPLGGGMHGVQLPQVQQMQGGPNGPIQGMQSRNGAHPQNWQSNFSVESPADHQFLISGPPISSSQQNDFGTMMMNDGAMMDVKGTNNNGPANQPQDDFVIQGAYGQQEDQVDDAAQMMKIKETLDNDADETGLGLVYTDSFR